ncbi:MAG: hypothetical protein MZV63_56330 [Marinilabiliales bacterium]|nr:hypothetical protein [Marinilabiliales bacterium]
MLARGYQAQPARTVKAIDLAADRPAGRRPDRDHRLRREGVHPAAHHHRLRRSQDCFVSAISTDIIPTQGTAIGDAITKPLPPYGRRSKNRIKPSSSSPTARTTRGTSLEQAEAACKARHRSSIPSEWDCPTGRRSPSITGKVHDRLQKGRRAGTIVVTRLDEPLLAADRDRREGDLCAGQHIRRPGLNPIYGGHQQLKMQETEIESRQFTDYEARFQYFLGHCAPAAGAGFVYL